MGICYLQRMLLVFYNALVSYDSYSCLVQRKCYEVRFTGLWADWSSSLVCPTFTQQSRNRFDI